MNKAIEYYMNLPYTIELWGDADEGWFVRVREPPGCMRQGETAEEALAMIREAKVDRLRAFQAQTAAELDALPAVLDRAFRGKLLGAKCSHMYRNDMHHKNYGVIDGASEEHRVGY